MAIESGSIAVNTTKNVWYSYTIVTSGIGYGFYALGQIDGRYFSEESKKPFKTYEAAYNKVKDKLSKYGIELPAYSR